MRLKLLEDPYIRSSAWWEPWSLPCGLTRLAREPAPGGSHMAPGTAPIEGEIVVTDAQAIVI